MVRNLIFQSLIFVFFTVCVKHSDLVYINCFNDDTTDLCDVRRLIVLYDHEESERPGYWWRFEFTTTPLPIKRPKPSTNNETTTRGTTTTQEPFRFLPKTMLLISHCNTTYLPHKLSTPFPHLTSLFVWYSGLREVFIDSLSDLPNLININFENNLLEVLDEATFLMNINVKYLNLGFNKIKVLNDYLIAKLVNIEHFIANNNQIEFISTLFFINSQKLSFINLNSNRIKVFAFNLEKCPKLVKVLGLGNDCANFYLTKRFTKVQFNQVMKENCSYPRTTTVAVE